MKNKINNPLFKRKILVTGGAGFIGSNYLGFKSKLKNSSLVNLDKLTYAGALENIQIDAADSKYEFIHGDICDFALLLSLFEKHKIDTVIHFAAESHVDNAIHGPRVFVESNIVGTFNLLEACKRYWLDSDNRLQPDFSEARFIHVSTDEVYGTLGEKGYFNENTCYAPNSPYSASKASSDFLVRSYYETYGLPAIITHCSNNYGPNQHNEKLIPTIIRNAMNHTAIPIYGQGKNVRDWLYVLDHCKAIELVLEKGVAGEVYNIGGNNEMENLSIARKITAILDELRPLGESASYTDLITFVKDRLGHDFRYAIDSSKIESQLGWKTEESFDSGLRKTIVWYLQKYATQLGC